MVIPPMLMKTTFAQKSVALLPVFLAWFTSSAAEVTVTSFDNFTADTLFGSWGSGTIQSAPASYVVTAVGYGSAYKYIGASKPDGTGATTVRLDVTLSGPSAANGKLGPLIDLVDGDGTRYSYRWYGQTLGAHVLSMAVRSPSAVVDAGATPGLDLANLQHMHLQLDPGAFGTSGSYTVYWNDLSLTGIPALRISSQSYNSTTSEFTLTWVSLPGKTYTILHTADLSAQFAPLVTGIPSGGTATTNVVTMPAGSAGFIRVQQE